MTTSVAPLFSHYWLYYCHYILSHYVLSLHPQSFCQRNIQILHQCMSQFEIRLLIFAWCSALHREVVTNLISSLICCHEFTTHRFFHDGWLVSERQGLQRESLMLQSSTMWLMDFALVHSDHLQTCKHNILQQFSPFWEIHWGCKSSYLFIYSFLWVIQLTNDYSCIIKAKRICSPLPLDHCHSFIHSSCPIKRHKTEYSFMYSTVMKLQ